MTIEMNSAITPTGLFGHTALTGGKVTPTAARTLLNVAEAEAYMGVPTALTATGSDSSSDAGKLLVCNASSIITRTLPSSLGAVGQWIEYLNLSDYPVKISAGTDGINAAGFDYIYLLKGCTARLIYASASDPKWICTGYGDPAALNASSGDILSTTSTTLADVTGYAFRLPASEGFWFRFDVPFTSAATTTGIKLGVTLANSTRIAYNVAAPVAADGVSAFFFGTGATSGDAVTATGVETVSGSPVYLATVEGFGVCTVDGSLLQLQAATEVGSSTITIKQRCRGRCWWQPTG